MKALIWIGTFLVITLVNALLGANFGFHMGSLVMYVALFFVPKMLCKKWDKHVFYKKVRESGMTAIEYVKSKTKPFIIENCEEYRGNEVYLNEVLQQRMGEGYLTENEFDILMEEYAHV